MTSDRRYYVSVETDFFTHPKVAMIGRELAFKHLAAIAWCHQHLTDGFVPEASIGDLHVGKRDVSALVKAGFWEATAGGWRIHDYLRHQPSRAEMRNRSVVGKRAAQTRWAAEADAKRNAEANAERMRDASEGHRGTHAEANAKPMPSYSQIQTHTQSDSSRPHVPAREPDQDADRSRDQVRGRAGLHPVGDAAAKVLAAAAARSA